METDKIDQALDDAKNIELENWKKAKLVKTVLGTKNGKKVIDILKNHFDMHLTSASAAKFNPNETFYLDGQKSVLLTIDQILEGGIWPKPANSQTEEHEDDEQTNL